MHEKSLAPRVYKSPSVSTAVLVTLFILEVHNSSRLIVSTSAVPRVTNINFLLTTSAVHQE